ncbi:MAG: hypothetical protein ACI845_002701 [Gammaproteobacteria bacterium]|jgi:hypothetical protein
MNKSQNRASIEDINYWKKINPDSRITSQPWPTSSHDINFESEELARYKRSLISEGYFQTRPCIDEDQLDKLITCTSRVMLAGHAPAYALLYDDFFEILSSLNRLLTELLGTDFLMVPDEPDVYFIPTSNQHGGTEPHRDTLRHHNRYDDTGIPDVINIWIPLTDSTPLNSCMHVIPAHSDPDFYRPGSDDITPRNFDSETLQSVRALPAKAGSVLGWSTSLLHWGGRSSQLADIPRLSFAMYFQRGGVKKHHQVATTIPFKMSFDYRLYLVEKVWRDPDGIELPNFIETTLQG